MNRTCVQLEMSLFEHFQQVGTEAHDLAELLRTPAVCRRGKNNTYPY